MPKPKRRANRGEQTIVTIHGIRTDGPWQQRFEAVFDPHFHYESFKYTEFQSSLGAIFFLSLEWVALAVLLALAIVEWRAGWLTAYWLPWLATILSFASLLWLARVFAETRRARVLLEFVNFVDCAVGSGAPPHIVAHSLGSFILGRALLRFPEFNAAKIVLLGCVLTPNFKWDLVRKQFDLVRNELGGKDWVGTIAAALTPFVPELGSAGKQGFAYPVGAVKMLQRDAAGAPWRPCLCRVCSGGSANLAVLNIDGQGIGHLDLTAVTLRARARWLPYFWDIPPDHFQRFKDLCLECDFLEANEDPILDAKLAKLRNDCWFWSQGPLDEFLRRYLRALTLEADEDSLRTVATNLFRTVAAATRATDRAEQRYLFPMQALKFAVQRTRGTRGRGA